MKLDGVTLPECEGGLRQKERQIGFEPGIPHCPSRYFIRGLHGEVCAFHTEGIKTVDESQATQL